MLNLPLHTSVNTKGARTPVTHIRWSLPVTLAPGEFNPTLDAGTFRFKTPAGVEIVDLRS